MNRTAGGIHRRSRLGRIASFMPLALTALAAFWLALPASAAEAEAESSFVPCAWPLENTGSGRFNVAAPDTDATYWAMAIDTNRWSAMKITGQYPQSRFFSYVTYHANGSTVDSIIDADIAPDAGSTNPFASATAGDSQSYTLTIDGQASGSGNHIQWGDTGVAYVIYRVYVADQNQDRAGGVPVPAVSLVDSAGVGHAASQCTRRELLSQLPGVKELHGRLRDLRKARTCPASLQPGAVTFQAKSSSGGGFFSNPANIYVFADDACLTADKVIVVRGQAANYPDTYLGGSVFDPALAGSIQLRYWSLCNNEEVWPAPVVDCAADHSALLDSQGYYTYVLSTDGVDLLGLLPQPAPSWLPAGATWLYWGQDGVPEALLFREMLPAVDFSLTGTYFPTGALCDKQVFIDQGWQGCFSSAGVTPP